MILHPLVLSVTLLDLATLVLVVAASLGSIRVVLGWDPGASGRRQLALERGAERASLEARLAVVVFALGTALYLVAIAGVLPELIPGAMCGTGVVQSMGLAGSRSLVLRGLAAIALWAWLVLDQLGRSTPRGSLAPVTARALLLSVPIVALAGWDTGRALAAIDLHQAVDCCAAVYEVAARAGASRSQLDEGSLVAGFAVTSLVLVVASLVSWRSRGDPGAIALGPIVAVWTPIAFLSLVRVFGSYHYGVLHHHCPWCLFLPEHRMVGYPILGAALVVVLEAVAGLGAAVVGRRFPVLSGPARARRQRAGLRVAVAAALFGVVVAGPAVVWRLRFGVWMG